MQTSFLGGSRTNAVAGLTTAGLLLCRRGLSIGGSAGGSSASSSRGPIAAQAPHAVQFGAVDGENRGTGTDSLAPFAEPILHDDPWFWLRDDERKNPEVQNRTHRTSPRPPPPPQRSAARDRPKGTAVVAALLTS
jgi:hypothetical protein